MWEREQRGRVELGFSKGVFLFVPGMACVGVGGGRGGGGGVYGVYGGLRLGIVGGWGGMCGWDIRVEVGRENGCTWRSVGGGMSEGWERVGEARDGRTERSLAFPGRGNEKDPWLHLLFLCTQYTARLLISHAYSRIYIFS